jgi:hypothetical protein
MIRHLVLLFALCCLCHGAVSKPLLVVLELNPWLSAVGSDSPTFALYDDGTVVYLREKPTAENPFQNRKTTDAKAKAKELLGFAAAKMKSHYALSSATDQITTVIWTPEKKIEIYGSWRKPRKVDGDSNSRWKAIIDPEIRMRESLPREIRAMLARIDQERSIEGKSWFPAAIEVMLWPYEYAPDASIAWPKDWPALSAKDTRKRGDSFSVFVPSDRFSELRSFLATRKEKGAVLIDGKKMAVAIRFPFPGEEAWMR